MYAEKEKSNVIVSVLHVLHASGHAQNVPTQIGLDSSSLREGSQSYSLKLWYLN